MKKITLAAVLIIITANVTLANNYRTNRIHTSTGKILEIISIIEAPVKEIIPGYEEFVAELWRRHNIETKDIEIYVEPEVAYYYSQLVPDYTEEAAEDYMATVRFVKSIYIPEETVNDHTIDTKTIYEEIMAEKRHKNRLEALSLINDIEEESTEECPLFPHINIARVK